MRIWDLPPDVLCDKHLLGEHQELHGLFNILTKNLKGYRNHPETKRWVGYTKALWNRHEDLREEMKERGFNHKSPLPDQGLVGPDINPYCLSSVEEQKQLLISKGCKCKIHLI